MRTLITPETLPAPDFVTVPTFDEIFAAKLERWKSLNPDYAYYLAADPVVKLLRMMSLEDLTSYALMNDRARATLLTHAEGIDLDGVGANWSVVRMIIQAADPDALPPVPEIKEDDNRFRARIADAIIAIASTGTEEHYRFHAMSSDIRVKDAVVFSPDLPNFLNMGGRVSIAILSSESNGVPSLDLLSVVRARVTNKATKMVSDIVEVEPAVIRPIDVVADFILERDASPDILMSLEATLRTEFAKAQRLGWDAPKSWFTRVLSPEGVYESILVSPNSTFAVRPNQFPHLNSVNLRFAGLAAQDDWNNDELLSAKLLRDVHEKYISYAVATKRTRVQIQNELIAEMRVGIVQPSLVGLADYLGLVGIRPNGVLIANDEIAIMIHYTLSQYYERGYYSYAN